MSAWGDAADEVARDDQYEPCHVCGYVPISGGHAEDCRVDR